MKMVKMSTSEAYQKDTTGLNLHKTCIANWLAWHLIITHIIAAVSRTRSDHRF